MPKISYYIIGLILIVLLVGGGCTRSVLKTGTSEARVVDGEAASTFSSVSPRRRVDPLAFHYYTNGILQDAMGDHKAAAGSYGMALHILPNSREMRFSLAEQLYKLQNYDSVLLILRPVRPLDGQILSLRASCYRALGQADSTHMAYRELTRFENHNAMAYSFLAGWYRQADQPDSVIWAYENMVRIRSHNYRAWQELGRLRATSGKLEDARDAFNKSISINPTGVNINTYAALADIYQQLGKIDSAAVTLRRGLVVEPNNLMLNRTMSVGYLRMDSLESAFPYTLKLAQLDPDNKDAVRRLGLVYYSLDSLNQADSIFSGLIATGDRSGINHFYLGRIALRQENLEKARDQFKIVTEIVDSVAGSWLDLGFVYGELGDTANQILTYQAGLGHVTSADDQGQLLFSLGVAYERNGQAEQAMATFEEIVALNPNHSQALNYLGYMLAERSERLDYAKDLIKRAMELSPDNAAYLDSYGWVLYQKQDYKKAIKHLKRAVELDNDPAILDHLGDAYNAGGDSTEARLWWRKALELNPDNDTIREKLGD